MNEHKQSKFIIDVSAPAKRPNLSTTRFFSYDSHTAEIVIQAEKDGKLIDQALVDTVEIYFESVNLKYRPIDGLKWNDTMGISADGLYSYILPDDFLNYEGLVAFDVYINYKNGDRADSSNRIIFEQRISAIDRAAGAVELVYIKDMEQAKQAVQDKADEVMVDMSGYESSLADYEHQIKDGMDQLYDGVANVSADEITKIREELPKVETVATEEITKIQAVLPDVQATAADETAKIKAQLPIVQTVATEEIGKIRDVLSTVENTAQEVSDHADQKIAEYDAKFVSTDQKMAELEQSQVALDAELKATQQQIIDADVYTKAEADANAEGILDKRNLSPAWSWSKDGTDRFTTVYPGENLLLDTDFNNLPKYWTSSDGKVTGDFNGHNFVYCDATNITGGYTNVLQQPIYDPTLTTNRVLPSHWYTLSFYAKGLGQMLSFIYSSFVDTSAGSYIDGVALGYANYDGKHKWDLTDGWTRHTYTFKSKSSFPATGIQNVLFRALKGSEVYICMPKLDEGTLATPYTPSPLNDYANAYPKYKGLRLAPSDNPADYDWSYTDEYVDYLKSSSVSKTEFNDLAARLTALENKEV